MNNTSHEPQPPRSPRPCSTPHSAPVAWLDAGFADPHTSAAPEQPPERDSPTNLTPRDNAPFTPELKVRFCEALAGGGVEHGRVIAVWPEQHLLRMQAALGPLQDKGVSAVLTFQVKPADGGSEIVETYNVGGATPQVIQMAPAVDRVLAEQLGGLKAYIDPHMP